MNKLLVICGPTATGKTALAARLAKKFNGELVSADSRQVYRGNDLETNKERPEGVRIWLYDVADQGEEFSVSHWVRLAREAIFDIRKRGKLPIVVGGTGLYIKALLDPFETIDIPPNIALREKNLSVQELQKMTTRGVMNDSDWNNPRRLLRKIEIAGKSLVRTQSEDALIIGLTMPLSDLYKRLDARHRPIYEHAIARKQLTWFKKQKDIRWFDCTSPALADDVIYLIRNVQKD